MFSNINYKRIIEGVILAAHEPLSVEKIAKIFDLEQVPTQAIKEYIREIKEDYKGRSMQLKEVASGYRFQISQDIAPWVQKIWQEQPTKYSRALLETLALIVYRQPITRAEMEDIRGVAVSTTIIKTLLEREWIKVVGHKDVPGKPALYATTKQFLDDLNLKALSDLPPLTTLQNTEESDDSSNLQLQLSEVSLPVSDSNLEDGSKMNLSILVETTNE